MSFPLHPVPQLSIAQQLLSLLVPVRIRTGTSVFHPVLELYRYRGRWQLATEDALYSDGAIYSPLRKAFGALGDQLAKVETVLVLGAGLGRAVYVLERVSLRPRITLVDLDEQVLQWAIETLEEADHADHVEVVCEDASQYVLLDTATYDLLIIDLFRGRVVPDFATSVEFLKQCRHRLSSSGILVFNYIVNDKDAWKHVKTVLDTVFSSHRIIRHGINRIVLVESAP